MALVVARWIHFASVSVLFGSSLWLSIAPEEGSVSTSARTNRTFVAAIAAVLSGIAWPIVTLATITGDIRAITPDIIGVFLFETPFGPILMVRGALCLILVVVTFGSIPHRRRQWIIAMMAAALLVSQGWLGHAMAADGIASRLAMKTIYAVHVLAAGFWIGALPDLLLRLYSRSSENTYEALSCYSIMAAVAVALIVATGIANTLFHAGRSFHVFLDSRYAAVLVVKIVLVVAMLAFAAWNRFVAMPRLQAKASSRPTYGGLRRGILSELVLGGMVFGVAAVLGVTPPPG